MNKSLVSCPRCDHPLPAEFFNADDLAPCPACQVSLRVLVFPSFSRPFESEAAAPVLGNESSCFYHPQKKASVICDGCGRFLCSLCELNFGGQLLCPKCLESGQKTGKLDELETDRVAYDRFALTLAVVSFLLGPLAVFTGPAALIIVLVCWKKPMSIVRNSKWRFVVAAIAGVLATAWGIFIWMLTVSRR